MGWQNIEIEAVQPDHVSGQTPSQKDSLSPGPVAAAADGGRHIGSRMGGESTDLGLLKSNLGFPSLRYSGRGTVPRSSQYRAGCVENVVGGASEVPVHPHPRPIISTGKGSSSATKCPKVSQNIHPARRSCRQHRAALWMKIDLFLRAMSACLRLTD